MKIKQYLATGAVITSLGALSLGCGASEAEMLKQQMEYESKLYEQEIEHTKSLSNKEIESLKQEIESLKQEIEKLQEQRTLSYPYPPPYRQSYVTRPGESPPPGFTIYGGPGRYPGSHIWYRP